MTDLDKNKWGYLKKVKKNYKCRHCKKYNERVESRIYVKAKFVHKAKDLCEGIQQQLSEFMDGFISIDLETGENDNKNKKN